jgi:hypothetical protein
MGKAPTARWLAIALMTLATLGLGVSTRARAQLPTSEERLKILTDPETLKKRLEKDKTRPPLEMFRSQVAPFDILPYIKPNHWSTLSLEMRANYDDYAGSLQTAPVRLAGQPQDVIFHRDARLQKTQRTRLGLQVYLPEIPKELSLEIVRPDAVRADEVWQAALRVLERQQMLILILTKDASNAYALWNRYQALYPHSVERGDVSAQDKRRYYRLVLPSEPDKQPPLSSHPLTWTTISHAIWDGYSPDSLNPTQQQAMLDWLHWGGQLVVVGGAGPSFSILKDSFLSPYLPAEVTGENALLGQEDLQPLSEAYRPPYITTLRGVDEELSDYPEVAQKPAGRYRPRAPILPAPNRPVFLAGLRPNPGAVGISLGEAGNRLLGVEQRVGRGRVLMLGINPTDPALAAWPGLDTFVRRVVLRRPEESKESRDWRPGRINQAPHFGPLPGPDLTWVRFLSRDLKGSQPPPQGLPQAVANAARPRASKGSPDDDSIDGADDYAWSPDLAVAEWDDSATVPRLCRSSLEEASGIKIPDAGFVLKVILAYVLSVVPLNWLICRYLFGRRELAWVVVPALSLAFGAGVERAAAYDMGYNSACDEIDLVEVYGDYPRAHVSRFASLYSTGRTRYTVAFPSDPTALALPLDNGRSQRGEDVSTAVFRSYPVPALESYLVQPRSLAFYRAEQLTSLDGSISLESSEEGGRKVVNGAGLELRDAVLIDLAGPKERKETYLGTIAPGATVEVTASSGTGRPAAEAAGLDPEPLLQELRTYYENRPESAGEIRLVAWSPKPVGGQKIEPGVDRHRGVTAFVIHLKNGTPPAPDGPVYDATLRSDEPSIPPPASPAPGPGRMPRPSNRPGSGKVAAGRPGAGATPAAPKAMSPRVMVPPSQPR